MHSGKVNPPTAISVRKVEGDSSVEKIEEYSAENAAEAVCIVRRAAAAVAARTGIARNVDSMSGCWTSVVPRGGQAFARGPDNGRVLPFSPATGNRSCAGSSRCCGCDGVCSQSGAHPCDCVEGESDGSVAGQAESDGNSGQRTRRKGQRLKERHDSHTCTERGAAWGLHEPSMRSSHSTTSSVRRKRPLRIHLIHAHQAQYNINVRFSLESWGVVNDVPSTRAVQTMAEHRTVMIRSVVAPANIHAHVSVSNPG